MTGLCMSSSFLFCEMLTSIEHRVGTSTVKFSQLYRKNRSRLCRGALRSEIVVDSAEALYVRKLGRWYSVLQLLLTRR